jgi:hypothetical protein
MRPADDIERTIRNWNETTSSQMDERVLADLGQIQKRNSTPRATYFGRYAAVAAFIVVAMLLATRITSRGPAPTETEGWMMPDIESINALAISMAYRRGGMEAVDEQYEKAFAESTYQPDRLSVETLLNELTDDSGS